MATIKTTKTVPVTFKYLPVAAAGVGLIIAHSNRPAGSNKNSILSYIGYSLVFGILGYLPTLAIKSSKDKALIKESVAEKNGIDTAGTPNADLESAFYRALELSKSAKSGRKVTEADKPEFAKAYSLLTDKEKLAFAELQVAVKDSYSYKKDEESYASVMTAMTIIASKYGADAVSELNAKMGKFS